MNSLILTLGDVILIAWCQMAKLLLNVGVSFIDYVLTGSAVSIGLASNKKGIEVHVFNDSGDYSIATLERPEGLNKQLKADILGHNLLSRVIEMNSAPRLSTLSYIGSPVSIDEVPIYDVSHVNSGEREKGTDSGEEIETKVRFLIRVRCGRVDGYYEFDWDDHLELHDVLYSKEGDDLMIRLTTFGYLSYRIVKYPGTPKGNRKGKMYTTALIYFNGKLVGRLCDDSAADFTVGDYAVAGLKGYFDLVRKRNWYVHGNQLKTTAFDKYVVYAKFIDVNIGYYLINVVGDDLKSVRVALKEGSYFEYKKATIMGTERELFQDRPIGYDDEKGFLFVVSPDDGGSLVVYKPEMRIYKGIKFASWDPDRKTVMFSFRTRPYSVYYYTGEQEPKKDPEKPRSKSSDDKPIFTLADMLWFY